MQEIRDDIAQVKGQLNEVLTALVGDKITKDGGLVKRITNTEEGLQALNARVDKVEKKLIPLAIHTRLLFLAAGAILMAIFSLILK